MRKTESMKNATLSGSKRSGAITVLLDRVPLNRVYLVSGLIFLLPIAVLVFYVVAEAVRAITFTQREIATVELVAPTLKIEEALQAFRSHKHMLQHGATHQKDEVATSEARIDELVAQYDPMFRNRIAEVGPRGRALALTARWHRIKRDWQNTKVNGANMSASQSYDAISALINDLSALIRDLQQLGGLSLDSEPGSYYLQNAVTAFLPDMAEALARVRDLGRLAAAKRTFGENERAELLGMLQGDVKSTQANVNDNVRRAAMDEPQVELLLGKELATVEKSVGAINTLARRHFLDAERTEVDTETWTRETSRLVDDVYRLGEQSIGALRTLFQNRIDDLYRALIYKTAGSLLLVAIAFVVLFSLGSRHVEREKRRAEEAELVNRENQKSILILLDELGKVAEGDLTVKAKVTEQMTGAIADSINRTIDQLRNLVARINDTATQVTQHTDQAARVSSELLNAASSQATEIERTNAAVVSVAQAMKAASDEGSRSAEVARQMVAASERGAQTVHESIVGMNQIREQIQETAKRIKRLGESSQEISEIVDLISEITEQTNVLALNAAIQAAAAGEAGRGFSVVAEEVQRLAERSGDATRQIASLVRVIQVDTQDAVAAMERSTQGVVAGTSLSDAAGQALLDLGRVSEDLSKLIENISATSREQALSAARVSQSMSAILNVTRLTTQGTQQTASTISELAESAEALRGSVAGFKIR